MLYKTFMGTMLPEITACKSLVHFKNEIIVKIHHAVADTCINFARTEVTHIPILIEEDPQLAANSVYILIGSAYTMLMGKLKWSKLST